MYRVYSDEAAYTEGGRIWRSVLPFCHSAGLYQTRRQTVRQIASI